MNIFKEILKTMIPSKIEVIPNDQKDNKVAEQMSQLLNYAKDNNIYVIHLTCSDCNLIEPVFSHKARIWKCTNCNLYPKE